MEQWNKIPGYRGKYEASTLGNIRKIRNGRPPLVLKKSISGHGYYVVGLETNGIFKTQYVHKLVARAWIRNPKHKTQVDHINTDRLDNRLENLRWVTAHENNINPLTIKHRILARKKEWAYPGPFRTEKAKKTQGIKAKIPRRRPVLVYKDTADWILREHKWELFRTFPDSIEAAKWLGVSISSISYSCTGRGLCHLYKLEYGPRE